MTDPVTVTRIVGRLLGFFGTSSGQRFGDDDARVSTTTNVEVVTC